MEELGYWGIGAPSWDLHYTTGFPISRLWVDARLHRIYAGTNEVMKHIIGKAL